MTALHTGFNKQEDIAIIGMASYFASAENLYEFWHNIIHKKNCITDIDSVSSDEYWRKQDFYHPDPNYHDKVYAHKAGFVPPMDFDPVEYKIPPAILESISSMQLYALYTAKQAIHDAGLIGADGKVINRKRVGVILGGSSGNTLFSLSSRLYMPNIKRIMLNAGLSETMADDIVEKSLSTCLEWNEDSFPGFLGNVACGRIASHFDLGGTSFMVDAASASSLAAIKVAASELYTGCCDAVITGGINFDCSAFAFMCFSKTQALSPSNMSRPFDSASDGMMLGDGSGLLILKRFSDAQRDGNNIYAVIKGIGASSDGNAKSIFAPHMVGQVNAMERTYLEAGISPADIQLIEAHGTGSASGDNIELKSLYQVFSKANAAKKSIAIGSLKSQYGHTRCAAGAASMIKVALALHHKILPPMINVTDPVELINDPHSPFYLNAQERPWIAPNNGEPRRAAINGFGFGGTNFHAVLEEYVTKKPKHYKLVEYPATLLFMADNPQQLLKQCQQTLSMIQTKSTKLVVRQHIAQQNFSLLQAHHARLLLVIESAEQANKLLTNAVALLEKDLMKGREHLVGIYYQPKGKDLQGKVVALFPGQGSQYLDMASAVTCNYPEMMRSLEKLDAITKEERGYSLSGIIYPPLTFNKTERTTQEYLLTTTENAQPALGAISAGYYNILRGIGFQPDFAAGHSYGEVVALWATGVLSDTDFYRVSLSRGYAASEASKHFGADPGAMLAVGLNSQQSQEILANYPEVVIANDNSPQQTVLGGPTAIIHQLYSEINGLGVFCRLLPVSAAFHTQFIRSAYQPFLTSLSNITFNLPQYKLFSTATTQCYSRTTIYSKQLLAEQLIQPVQFRQTIESIYQQGGRLFVEIGPKNVLSKLVADILKDREFTVVSVNSHAKGGEYIQLLHAIAKLTAHGVRLNNTDPYLRTFPEQPQTSNHYTINIGGGIHFSEQTKVKRHHALHVHDNKMVKQCINKNGKVLAVETKDLSTSSVAKKQNNIMEPTSHNPLNLHNILQSQLMINQQHQQFQANQNEYIQLINSLISKQLTLLDKNLNNENLHLIVNSLSQSIQLLEKSLVLYHTNHDSYFHFQQALLNQKVSQLSAENLNIHKPITHFIPPTKPEPVAQFFPTAANQPDSQVVSPLFASTQASLMTSMDTTHRPHKEPRQAMQISSTAVTAQANRSEPVNKVSPVITSDNLAEMQAVISRLEAITEDKIINNIILLLSEKTGYPTEMIGVDMQLESDLGIDSIKRLETFSLMGQSFSTLMGSYGDAVRQNKMDSFDIESLSSIKNMAIFFKRMIREIIDDLHRQINGDHVGIIS